MIWLLDAGVRELLLFAGVGFLAGGLDDLLIDILWLWNRIGARFAPPPSIEALGQPKVPLRLAIFVAAWRESRVIGVMLRSALGRIRHPDFRIYVGCYPNDPETIAEVEAVAAEDSRVRAVIGPLPGPTTKADNLNVIWRALRHDAVAGAPPVDAVVLHDAEDVIDADELCVHDALLRAYPVVQTPVVALIDPDHPWVSGHYADEFAEGHGRQLVIRATLGRGLPLAGVGCAIRTEALALVAGEADAPFPAGSLVEDYELGLRLGDLGLPAAFARVIGRNGRLVATRAYFPSRFEAAVRQKARWMTGIALAGWDRLGWSRGLALGDHWMRMRDRRAPLALLVLAVAYLALLGAALTTVVHWLVGTPVPAAGPWLRGLLLVNFALLLWRLIMRAAMTGGLYGRREGLRAVPRLLVANAISLVAVGRALNRYLVSLAGVPPRWDKTEHVFPADAALAQAP